MILIKLLIFLWFLTGAVLCLMTLFTTKGKEIVENTNLMVSIIGILYSLIVSPIWLISSIVKNVKEGVRK